MPRKLRVRGKPNVLVPNPFALGTNPPRFVGKTLDYEMPAGAPLLDRLVDVEDEIVDDPLVREAVALGHLEALDAETVRLCRVALPVALQKAVS
jgi:hypothetical protein